MNMKKLTKKITLFCGYILSMVAMVLFLVNSAHAASVSLTVAPSGMSNVLAGAFLGNAAVTQVILTAPADNTASVRFVDSVTNRLSYTNAAYSTLSQYATNQITSWTNFFGTVNYMTNVAMVTYSNFVAAAIVPYPVRIIATAPTNGSYAVQGVNYYFNNGLWVTNTGSGSATVTVTYQQ